MYYVMLHYLIPTVFSHSFLYSFCYLSVLFCSLTYLFFFFFFFFFLVFLFIFFFFFFSSRRRHTRFDCDWSSDVCSSDLMPAESAVTTEPARYVGGEHRQERDLEQLHLVLGFPGLPLGDRDYYAASVLSTAFGGGMSSRLFQEVREKRGLCYAIHSFAHGYKDGGLFGIYAGTGEDEASELVPVLCDETLKLDDGLAPGELARAKAQMKAGLLMSLESTGARCEQMAQH